MATQPNNHQTLTNLTPLVTNAVVCWMQVEALTKAYNNGWTANDQKAYNLECQLFNFYFKNFSEVESNTYRDFVAYLAKTKLYLCDLDINELYEIYLLKK